MKDEKKKSITFEEIKVKGNQLVDEIRDIVKEGSARRIIIKKDDRTVLEFPLSFGIGGATAAILFAPQLAAIGAFAALVSDVSVVIEREVQTEAGNGEISETPVEEEA